MASQSMQLRLRRKLLAGSAGAVALALAALGIGMAPASADDTSSEPTVTEEVTTTETTVNVVEEVTSTERLTVQSTNTETGDQDKVFVCKYVGVPGVDERLQTGQNPISVSVNSIQNNEWNGTVPGYFSDAHDRSYVLAYDEGQSEPSVSACPDPDVPEVTEDPVDPTATAEILCTEEGLELSTYGTDGSEVVNHYTVIDSVLVDTDEAEPSGTYGFSTIVNKPEGSTFFVQIRTGTTFANSVERFNETFTIDCVDDQPTPVDITTGPSVTTPTCENDGQLVIPTIEHVTFSGGTDGDGPGDYTITASAETGYTLTGDDGPWNLTVLPKKTDASCDPRLTPSVCTTANTLPTSTNLHPQGAVLSDTSTVKYVDGGLLLESDNWVDAYVTFATNFELKDARNFFMDITVANPGSFGYAPIFHTSLGNIHGEELYSDELWTNSPGILPVTGGGQGGPYSGSLEDALAIGNPTVTSVTFLFTSATANSAILSQGGYNCLIQPFDYEAAPPPPVDEPKETLAATGQDAPIAPVILALLAFLTGAAILTARHIRWVKPIQSAE